jgi:hypothetical protein
MSVVDLQLGQVNKEVGPIAYGNTLVAETKMCWTQLHVSDRLATRTRKKGQASYILGLDLQTKTENGPLPVIVVFRSRSILGSPLLQRQK